VVKRDEKDAAQVMSVEKLPLLRPGGAKWARNSGVLGSVFYMKHAI
jgi:hypothetical protein